ncbi:MAG: enoyl-CoA hydratase-related protein [Dehalococcoidia bacterium]
MTMRRPAQLNAMTFTMIGELTDALYRAGDLDGVRVVAITREGEQAFSSGDDLINMGAGPEQRGPVTYNSRTHHHVMIRTIRRIPKPVVALLRGYCLGAGFDLALACDIRLAADNLAMGDQRPVRAIATLSGSSWFLPRLVGVGRATEMLLTGRRADAAEAERIGMVNFVYPLAEFDRLAADYLRDLARMPTFCLGTNKANIEFGLTNGLEAALAAEADRFAVNRRSDDAREGGLSFRERREPRYTGRRPGPATDDEIPF